MIVYSIREAIQLLSRIERSDLHINPEASEGELRYLLDQLTPLIKELEDASTLAVGQLAHVIGKLQDHPSQ